MRITRIALSDFKAHDALEIAPAAGLTIIRGPNEAGKSTIQQAIELVLFRKADANREDIRQAWSWGSSVPPGVTLDFEADGGSGRLSKRFGGSRSEGELTLDGQSITDYSLIGERVAELTGVPSEAFFRATASVGHTDLDRVAGDEPAVGDRLQKAVSGADRGTAKAKKKLETAIHRYRTEGHKNPGALKVGRAEIEMLEAELAEGEEALSRLQADRAQWVEAHERREELEVNLRRQQADLAEAQRAATLARQREEAQSRYDRLKRGVELVTSGDELQRKMPTQIPLPQLRTAVSRMDSLQYEISELEAEIDVVEEASADGTVITPPRPMRWLLLSAVFVILGWLASFFLSDAGLFGVFVVVILAFGVVLSLVQAVRGAGHRRQYGLAMEMAEAARTQHVDADRQQQEQFRRKRRELESMQEQLGVADVDAAERLLATAEERSEELAQIEGELRGLGIERRSARALEEARDEAANEGAQAGHALTAMGSLAEDPAAAQVTAQRLVAQTTPARDLARSEEDKAQGRVDANPVDAEIVAGLAERLAAARERQAEMERRLAVYQGTLEAMESAEQATLKTAARYLEERMGPAIATITDGRYDEIEVDERSLAFKVRAPESGEFVEVSQLSQGTADQLFLAARLGLVRLVTMDRRPPLILDDPFVTFDAGRGERALRLVKRFAQEQGFQVLYLTCSNRFDDLADELVVLPAPSKERVLAVPRAATTAAAAFAPAEVAEPEPAEPEPAEAAVPEPAEPEPAEVAPEPVEASEPTIRFEPDPRPNPDPLAPLRKAAEEASAAEHDTGIDDPFRLAERDGNEASD